MRRLALISCLIAPAALAPAGCGKDDTIQITDPSAASDEQKAALDAADKRVDDAERGRTPTAASLRKK